MLRKRHVQAMALLLTFVLVAAACGSSSRRTASTTSAASGTPGGTSAAITNGLDLSKCEPQGNDSEGVVGNTITFGSSYPQSGLYSAFADVENGAEAYVKYYEATNGGVTIAGKKYQLKFKDADDQYMAAKTVSNVQSFVNDDHVFGTFNVIGTSNNIAIRDFLGQQCIPDLFAGTGSPAWGNTKYPWLIGSTLAPYSDEVHAFVDFLKANKPNATVAILYATDDFGKAYEKTFKQLIQGTNIKVVGEKTYNPEDNMVDSQIVSLAATHADALLLGATLLACPSSMTAVKKAGWDPIVYVSGTCAAKTLIGIAGPAADGLYSTTNIMDPMNPKFASNPAMKIYMANLKKYVSDPKTIDVTNGIVAYGWTQGALLVYTLEHATAATRSAVMESALNIKSATNVGLQLPGTTFNSGPNDKFLGESFQMVQYMAAKGYFKDIGPLSNFDGQTKSFTPPDVING
jgi:branched-chain amino acid transport system substrate-binding protein